MTYGIYAAILALGGAMGYAKAKSQTSLIAGLGCAVVALGVMLLFHHHPRVSLGLGALLAIAVTIIFLQRFRKTKSAMPAMPMIVVSLAVLGITIAAYAAKH